MTDRSQGRDRAGSASQKNEPSAAGNGSERRERRHRAKEELRPQETSASEWVIAAISTAVVIGLIGLMIGEAVSESGEPPQIEIQIDTVIRVRSGHLVEFRARNRGQRTAADLTVVGELMGETGLVEKAEVTFGYIPEGAIRHGGLYFREDPTRYRLELRPVGYTRP